MKGLDAIGRWFAVLLSPVAAAALFAIMLVMVTDVTGRYFFNRPLQGAYEITEFLMCIMVLGAMPLASLWWRHVEASMLTNLAPGLSRRLEWLATALSVITFAYLAMLLWTYGDQLADQQSQSLFGAIPHAPFAYYMAILSALAAVGSALAIRSRSGGPGDDS